MITGRNSMLGKVYFSESKPKYAPIFGNVGTRRNWGTCGRDAHAKMDVLL